jgi:hypothetical protein
MPNMASKMQGLISASSHESACAVTAVSVPNCGTASQHTLSLSKCHLASDFSRLFKSQRKGLSNSQVRSEHAMYVVLWMHPVCWCAHVPVMVKHQYCYSVTCTHSWYYMYDTFHVRLVQTDSVPANDTVPLAGCQNAPCCKPQ